METINVTWDHIIRGDKENPESCAIALAINDLVGHTKSTPVFERLCVDYNRLVYRLLGDDVTESIRLPEEATEFIYNFDRNKTKVKPFSFKLPIALGNPLLDFFRSQKSNSNMQSLALAA